MPELPEVETVVRQLQPKLQGAQIRGMRVLEDLGCDLAGKLEQIVVEQEEARQPQGIDDPQLLLQTGIRLLTSSARRVPRVQTVLAEL